MSIVTPKIEVSEDGQTAILTYTMPNGSVLTRTRAFGEYFTPVKTGEDEDDFCTLDEFNDRVEEGDIDDYDGYGYYATKDYVFTDLVVDLDDIEPPMEGITHVVWYNR